MCACTMAADRRRIEGTKNMVDIMNVPSSAEGSTDELVMSCG